MIGSPGLNKDVAIETKYIGNPNNVVIDRYLDTVGDGSGTTAMNVAADEFLIAPSESEFTYVIDEMKILIGDTAGAFSINGFGNGAVLANGFKLEIRRGTNVERTMFDDIVSNAEVTMLGDAIFHLNNTMLDVTIRWPAPLRIPYGYSLVLQTQDNMGTMEFMKARVKGRSFRNNS